MQRVQLDFMRRLNESKLKRKGHEPGVEGVIESFELGFRMQDELPELMDLSGESKKTLENYGIDGSGGSFGSALRSGKRLELHLAEFHPAGMVFGAVGLDGEVARSKVLGEALRILVVDDLFAVEPDLNVWAKSFDTQGIPLLGFAVFVFGIALVEPVVEVEPDWFVGRSPADVHLKAVAFLFQVVAQIDPAVVFSVFIDFEF